MTKQELINNVAKRVGVEKTVTAAVVDEVIAVMQENLIKGEPTCIRGLFTLTTKVRAEKTARNVTAGTTVSVPAHVIPFAKFSKELKDKVKENVGVE